jgi:hypothetical protein
VAAEAADQAATDDRRTLGRDAADTWRSFELLLDPGTWPVDGNPVYPFLSSVDNGWMAALLMVGNAVPELRGQARDLLAPMDFGSSYDPAAGLLRGGFWVDPPGGQCTIPGNYRDPAGPPVLYTCHHGGFYDAVNVDNGQVSRYWLALDQGMVMAALGNELTGDRLQRYLTRGEVERAVRPLLAMEEFTAGG